MFFRTIVGAAAIAVVCAAVPARAQCTGDCDGSGDVTVNEIIAMVNIALGSAAPSSCFAGDADSSGDITINEIVAAVNNALSTCSAIVTPTVPHSTPTPTPSTLPTTPAAPGAWTDLGPDVGEGVDFQVNVIALDYKAGTIYVGSDTYFAVFGTYHIYSSTDAGASWTPSYSPWSVGGDDGVLGSSQSSYGLALDPTNPQTVYAGTSARDLQASYGAVMKSTDGGTSWVQTSYDPPNTLNGSARVIAIDPTASQTIYAGKDYLFKSTDGGDSWTSLPGIAFGNPGQVFLSALAIAPSAPDILYAGAWFRTPGIPTPHEFLLAKSTDAGASWSESSPFPATVEARAVQVLLVDPNDPNIVYAGTDKEGLFKTTTGAGPWLPISTGLEDVAHVTQGHIAGLVLDPTAPQTLYACTQAPTTACNSSFCTGGGVFKTTDGGKHWAPLTTAQYPRGRNCHAVALDPDAQILYAGLGSYPGPDHLFSIQLP